MTATLSPPSATAAVPATGGRRAGWDVLRVLFVLLVVLYHSTYMGPVVEHGLIPRKLVFPHQVGASLLLVLSAYFVAATVRKHGARPGGSARWWWGKLARLLPAFAVATVVAWAVLRVANVWFVPGKRDLVANLLMAWNWNGLFRWEFVDGSYWTIPLQLMAFTVAAVLWRTPLGRGRPLRVLLWALLVLPIAQLPLLVSMPGTLYQSLVLGFGEHRWHLFVAGVAIWMYSTGRLGRRHFALLLAGCLAAHAVHTAVPDPASGVLDTDPYAVLGIAIGVLLMTAVAVGPDWGRWIPARVMRVVGWLAGISYGVFLTHQTVGYVIMFRLQLLGVGPTLQTAAMVVVAGTLGWAMTRLVESPAHRTLVAAWDRVVGRYRRPVAVGAPLEDVATPLAAAGAGSRSTSS